ncbi:MAG: iron-sulfur cluster assembly accessory protein [Candidimonas sp.]
MIKLTESAKNKFSSTGGRFVFEVNSRGCNGFSYHLDHYDGPVEDDDFIYHGDGFEIIVPSMMEPYLGGTELDWVDDLMASHFVFRNPNAQSSCGCGESFSCG